ncbi:MAG: protease [Cryomorphaceae bacterium]|nr:MAG: protease [Cryomorphaceae bacterium]
MAAYTGIHTQIARNNRLSAIYLMAFPLLIFAAVWVFFFLLAGWTEEPQMADPVSSATDLFVNALPAITAVVLIWFLIAYFANTSMIRAATGAKTLSRKENMRVYNLCENLCMSQGMAMPKLNIIESPALNAFASGINQKTYTVTLTRGIIDKLNDEELEGVIAHELMHIRNHDVRLLIISIIFVGIFSFAVQIALRSFFYGSMGGRRSKDAGKAMIIALVIALIAYFLSLIFKFGLSRKREYMADAGAADMTKNPRALASALRKISGNHQLDVNDDVKQLFIENEPQKDSKEFSLNLTSWFATHPPIDRRIQVLEQF